MRGIVERLRSATVRFANESNEEAAIRRNQAITEAADEIGRLRRELEEARKALEEIASVKSEVSNERFRFFALATVDAALARAREEGK